MKLLGLSRFYLLIPLLNRAWNFILIPVAFHMMTHTDFVGYNIFFLYSFVFGILMDFGFRQKVLYRRLKSTSSFLSYGNQLLLPVALICLGCVIFELKFPNSDLPINFILMIIALADCVLQSIIVNGYLANLIVFDFKSRFKSFSTLYGLYFFLIRLISLIFLRQLLVILVVIILCKFTAILVLDHISKSFATDKISAEGQDRYRFKDEYSYNTVFSFATVIIISADRIIGNSTLSNKEMAHYFLIYQYVSAASSIFEQYITLNYRSLVKRIEAGFSLHKSAILWIALIFLASAIVASALKSIYGFEFKATLHVIFFQSLIAVLWAFYLVLMFSFNSHAKYLKRGALIHASALVISSVFWFIAYRFGGVTLSSLAAIVFLSFNFLVTCMLFTSCPQVPSLLRRKIIEQSALANAVVVILICIDRKSFTTVLLLGTFLSTLLELSFLNKMVSKKELK